MEFREFDNPEEADYDIKSSLSLDEELYVDDNNSNKGKDAFLELYFQLGCPEDFELKPFGITEKEMSNPTKETYEKLKKYAEYYKSLSQEKGKSK